MITKTTKEIWHFLKHVRATHDINKISIANVDIKLGKNKLAGKQFEDKNKYYLVLICTQKKKNKQLHSYF